jgi:hypothetical protein
LAQKSERRKERRYDDPARWDRVTIQRQELEYYKSMERVGDAGLKLLDKMSARRVQALEDAVCNIAYVSKKV